METLRKLFCLLSIAIACISCTALGVGEKSFTEDLEFETAVDTDLPTASISARFDEPVIMASFSAPRIYSTKFRMSEWELFSPVK